ncbi:TcpQ domain-containing protein [Xanthomonas campestris pv. campestris]|uniref:TcpQ domain-containing protein n=1 Tax=Xanthomonas campestris TaxID=339 RepID=UPI001E4FD7E3|nr:TcpQ domain-containing protein [Xanthomonas campestris]MCD0253111.1 TcpQ domain-containing protein [Xanthomonas campestris pv. campestris]
MKRVALSALLLLSIAAADSAAATPYSFDYTVTGANAFGIERVFDDGKNTVLRFINNLPPGDAPTVTTADGTPLPTRVVGPYLVLQGLQRHVLLYRKGIVAQVRQGRAEVPYPTPALAFSQPVAPMPAAPVAAVPQPAQAAGAPVVVSSSVAGIQTAKPVVVAGATPATTLTPATAAAVAAPQASSGGLAVITDELPPAPVWEAKPGSTLRTTTEAWAKQAGWTVRWLLADGDDYEVVAGRYVGDFAESLAKLYAPYFTPSFNGDKPLHVKAYAKPKVIVVSE